MFFNEDVILFIESVTEEREMMIGSLSKLAKRTVGRQCSLPNITIIDRIYHRGIEVREKVDDPMKKQLLEQLKNDLRPGRSTRVRVFNNKDNSVGRNKAREEHRAQKAKLIRQFRTMMHDEFVRAVQAEIMQEEQINDLVDMERQDLYEEVHKYYERVSDPDGKEVTLRLKTGEFHRKVVEITYFFNDIARDYGRHILEKRNWYLQRKDPVPVNLDKSQAYGKDKKSKQIDSSNTGNKWSAEQEQLQNVDEKEEGINFQLKLMNKPRPGQEPSKADNFLLMDCIGGNYGVIIRSMEVRDHQNAVVARVQHLNNIPVRMQKVWYEYLAESFKVDYNLALYVFASSDDVEKKAYMDWLQNLFQFRCDWLRA